MFASVVGTLIVTTTGPDASPASVPTPPLQYTGAPGENNCIICHTGTTGTADGVIGVIPTTGLFEYNPGETDTITVAITDLGQTRWGFELTALKNSNNLAAGTFATIFLPEDFTATGSAAGRNYVFQNSHGATQPSDPNVTSDGSYWGLPTSAGWFFEWTAPPPGSGDVTLYVSGVAADGNDFANPRDYSYTTSLVLHEHGTTAVQPTTWGKIKQIYH